MIKLFTEFLPFYTRLKNIFLAERGPCSTGALGPGLAGLCLKTALPQIYCPEQLLILKVRKAFTVGNHEFNCHSIRVPNSDCCCCSNCCISSNNNNKQSAPDHGRL